MWNKVQTPRTEIFMRSSIQGLFRPNTATTKSWPLCGEVLKSNVFIGAWVRTLQKMMARAGVRGKAFQRVERFSPRVPASYIVQCGGVRAPDMSLQITEMRTSIWPGWVPSTWHRSLLEFLHPFHKPVAQVSSRLSPAGSEGFRHWLKVRRVPYPGATGGSLRWWNAELAFSCALISLSRGEHLLVAVTGTVRVGILTFGIQIRKAKGWLLNSNRGSNSMARKREANSQKWNHISVKAQSLKLLGDTVVTRWSRSTLP